MHTDRFEALDKNFGLMESTTPSSTPAAESHSAGNQIAAVVAENLELRADIDRLRSERGQFCDLQRQIMELLGTRAPDKIIHDLRNVLNERDLLKSLVSQIVS